MELAEENKKIDKNYKPLKKLTRLEEYQKIVYKLSYLLNEVYLFKESEIALRNTVSAYIEFYKVCIKKIQSMGTLSNDKITEDLDAQCVPTLKFFKDYFIKLETNYTDYTVGNNEKNSSKLTEKAIQQRIRTFQERLDKYNGFSFKVSYMVKKKEKYIDKDGYLIPNPDGFILTYRDCPRIKNRKGSISLFCLKIKQVINGFVVYTYEDKENKTVIIKEREEYPATCEPILTLKNKTYQIYSLIIDLTLSVIIVGILEAILSFQKYPKILVFPTMVTIVFIISVLLNSSFKNFREAKCMTFGKPAYWLFLLPIFLLDGKLNMVLKHKNNFVLYRDKEENKHISYFHTLCPNCLNEGEEVELELKNDKEGVVAICKNAPKAHQYKFDHIRKIITPL